MRSCAHAGVNVGIKRGSGGRRRGFNRALKLKRSRVAGGRAREKKCFQTPRFGQSQDISRERQESIGHRRKGDSTSRYDDKCRRKGRFQKNGCLRHPSEGVRGTSPVDFSNHRAPRRFKGGSSRTIAPVGENPDRVGMSPQRKKSHVRRDNSLGKAFTTYHQGVAWIQGTRNICRFQT